ncbi:MAG: hypothetical protein IPH07_26260 [Deltaproteobacteria bacterium]|nr:hypothetical protein [Deltaproteobacteria bacterium]MBK8718266.1 hypothetical protein [Deltaproteobacteria bacterium]MBP7291090.1 hypothetical protein [Nannocystaceae bacterium]
MVRAEDTPWVTAGKSGESLVLGTSVLDDARAGCRVCRRGQTLGRRASG